jgi:hypothetical protein
MTMRTAAIPTPTRARSRMSATPTMSSPRNEVWWLAGLAGVAVGSVWNYAVSSVFTRKQK